MTPTQAPQYQCHKIVRALKIKSIEQPKEPAYTRPVCRGAAVFGSACGQCERCVWLKEHESDPLQLIFEDQGYAPHSVERSWVKKHDPRPGGYLVIYNDGYQSYSPAKAFEEGYTRINRHSFRIPKLRWIELYGGEELLDQEGFDVVPCECDDPYCQGWKVAKRADNRIPAPGV